MIMGSNMAECHPVAFRWPLKAKTDHGAVLMHVDPRFTRTSAMCDIHAPIRAGTDIEQRAQELPRERVGSPEEDGRVGERPDAPPVFGSDVHG